MNNIFYIHSNILTICCFQTIKECLAREEKVIIITDRGYTWPYFEGKVVIYDFAKLFLGEDKNRRALHSLKAIKDYIEYRRYIAHLKVVVDNIISKENFIFYLPSMAIEKTAVFAHNNFCKGYYYVDEGAISYDTEEELQRFIPKKFRNTIKSFLGIGDFYHFEISSIFLGTISITKDAFAWNVNKEKIINSVDDIVKEVKDDMPYFDDVILTEYLTQDYDVITQSIDYTIGMILHDNPNSKIGLKIHPQAISKNMETVKSVQHYVGVKYAKIVTFIPTNVSIEVMSLVSHPKLYSLLEVSSILLYALLFNSSITKLIECKNGFAKIIDINTVEEFNRFNLGR